jgi:hypothetical protein
MNKRTTSSFRPSTMYLCDNSDTVICWRSAILVTKDLSSSEQATGIFSNFFPSDGCCTAEKSRFNCIFDMVLTPLISSLKSGKEKTGTDTLGKGISFLGLLYLRPPCFVLGTIGHLW